MVNAQAIKTQEIKQMTSLKRLNLIDGKLTLDGRLINANFNGTAIVELTDHVNEKDLKGKQWGHPEFLPTAFYDELERQRPLYASEANAYVVGSPKFIYTRAVEGHHDSDANYAHYPVSYFKIQE